jgi:uncharacterized membrane protein YidH (DUF202 family)
MTEPDDPEDVDPGTARERTTLAWTRTAIAFAAVGGAVLKTNVAAGLTVLALAPVVWQVGRLSGHAPGHARPRQLLLTALAVTAVALVVLAVVLLSHGRSPGFHPPSRVQALGTAYSHENAAGLHASVGD